jgi:hypothetical protein
LGEEEANEKNFVRDYRRYESEFAKAVIDDFKQTSKHFRAFRTYNQPQEKRVHSRTKKIAELMNSDQQRISEHNFILS